MLSSLHVNDMQLKPAFIDVRFNDGKWGRAMEECFGVVMGVYIETEWL